VLCCGQARRRFNERPAEPFQRAAMHLPYRALREMRENIRLLTAVTNREAKNTRVTRAGRQHQKVAHVTSSNMRLARTAVTQSRFTLQRNRCAPAAGAKGGSPVAREAFLQLPLFASGVWVDRYYLDTIVGLPEAGRWCTLAPRQGRAKRGSPTEPLSRSRAVGDELAAPTKPRRL
jgi:hypothetical protein